MTTLSTAEKQRNRAERSPLSAPLDPTPTVVTEVEERRSLKSRRLNAEISWTGVLEAFKSANKRTGGDLNAAHLYRRRRVIAQAVANMLEPAEAQR